MNKKNMFPQVLQGTAGVAAVVLVCGLLFASCVTFEVVNGQPAGTGFLVSSTLDGKPEVGSYWKLGPWLGGFNGIIDIGYDDFVSDTQGQAYDILIKQYCFGLVSRVSAVAR